MSDDKNALQSDSYEELKRLRDRIDRNQDPELYSQVVQLLFERRHEEETAHLKPRPIRTKGNYMSRAIAFLIDYAAIFTSASIITALIPVERAAGGLTSRGLPALSIILFWVLFTVYIEQKKGATYGNQVVGLKPVSLRISNRTLTLKQSFLRHLFDIPDVFLGAIFIYDSKYHQRIGDHVARTIVIDTHDLNQGIFEEKSEKT